MEIQNFINSLSQKAIVLDNDLKITAFNKSLKEAFIDNYQNKYNFLGENYIEKAKELGFFNREQINLMKLNFKKIISQEAEAYSEEYSFAPDLVEDKNIYFEMDATSFGNGILILYKNITKQKNLEYQLKMKEQQYRAIFEKVPVGMILKDKKGKILRINKEACKISGFDKENLENNSIYGTLINKRDYEKVKKGVKRVLAGEDIRTNLEIYDARDKFQYLHLFETCINLPGQGECVFSMQIDLRPLWKKENKINFLESHDSLTGLFNKKYLENFLDKVNINYLLPITVIYADINGLKIINEKHGFATGDQVIKKISNLFNSITRKNDILVRMGGDEFSLILTNTAGETAKSIISRIRKKLNNIKIKDNKLSLGMGYATTEKNWNNLEDILSRAENNMNKDKLNSDQSYKYKQVSNLLKTLNVKSNETKEHVMRVEAAAKEFGMHLNLDYQKINELMLLAKLHDIGKVFISESILKKPGKLTEKEWQIMQDHTKRGFQTAISIDEFSSIAKYILHHHERWDGTGYPAGLNKEEIPLLARIISIVDSYDVMTHERPYSKPLSRPEALEEIKKCSGTQFDPKLASSFLQFMQKKENRN
ncbi:PAS domain S-box-containing protein/diguanylate cyclase (GGDEF)-like protein [Halanaerobium saccharolyticum]|uniref:PAS domain S-box-containing protein/diguanylate cyclase (GGDEF)-like protein n=1 Tax=Halanaerobium saccharolyticum TaxID=43595 RepID=A0A4R7YYU5_9FIRM|nr:HD domain-containing phosphohydrolase [Halanaerobium saccharolyticum]RAK08994.1 PAS domain S-box-containing protein/diguanylate cyclase (GGDEF)-like protein [Halanaerobium saccharolyticum]TDW02612.1 PAS domain S-box-containing protein/diguanylate cyclase (GGDEF)-like protein [Halanaerobium saccharolyticum]TDX60757.1 PAS domain S-box-containing protein/diguanylate cyclase (GGDEF)-like protein [Halanaerobium saccharolyticum]